jgi:hypothetical protein
MFGQRLRVGSAASLRKIARHVLSGKEKISALLASMSCRDESVVLHEDSGDMRSYHLTLLHVNGYSYVQRGSNTSLCYSRTLITSTRALQRTNIQNPARKSK